MGTYTLHLISDIYRKVVYSTYVANIHGHESTCQIYMCLEYNLATYVAMEFKRLFACQLTT